MAEFLRDLIGLHKRGDGQKLKARMEIMRAGKEVRRQQAFGREGRAVRSSAHRDHFGFNHQRGKGREDQIDRPPILSQCIADVAVNITDGDADLTGRITRRNIPGCRF